MERELARTLTRAELAEHLRPYCDHCGGGKLVDEIELEHHANRAVFVVTVRCHGETDTEELLLETTRFNRPEDFGRGHAFRKHRHIESEAPAIGHDVSTVVGSRQSRSLD